MNSTITITADSPDAAVHIIQDIRGWYCMATEKYNFSVQWKNEQGGDEVWVMDEGEECWVGRGSVKAGE